MSQKVAECIIDALVGAFIRIKDRGELLTEDEFYVIYSTLSAAHGEVSLDFLAEMLQNILPMVDMSQFLKADGGSYENNFNDLIRCAITGSAPTGD